MKFTRFLCWAVVLPAALLFAASNIHAQAAKPASQEKVLRYAFPIAETGFDPAQVSDLYSRILTANIFEALYNYDYLARPFKIRPVLAVALPEVTDNFKTYTIKIKQGVYFDDDPAFGGKKRELTAQDIVYSYKRHYDPKNKSPSVYLLENDKILGLSELKKAATAPGGK